VSINAQVVSLVAVLSGDASDAALHPLPSSADGRSTPNAYALGTLEVLVAERLPGDTAMKKLRIVRVGFGTARQKRVLE
jgi:hypothetical protein